MFEGADTGDARVEFQVFQGQTEVTSDPRKSTCFEPKLQSTNTDAAVVLQEGEDEEFLEKFMQQFEFINKNYEKEKHGQMLCFGRFGKTFYPKFPPKSTMTINELSELIGPPAPKVLNPMFAPQSLPHDKVQSFLLREGYQQVKSCCTEYEVTLKVDQYHKEIILHLDEDFNVKLVASANNIKWLAFVVKRQNLEWLDIRFMFQSVDNIFTDSEDSTEREEIEDPTLKRFLSSKVIRSVDGENVNIDDNFIDDVTFIRRKKVSAYKKRQMENGDKRGFEATVFLMNVKQYACRLGSFIDVSNWTSEVVVLPVVPNTKNKEESAKFTKEFIRFCFSLEKATHQP